MASPSIPTFAGMFFSRHSLEIHGTALMIKNELTWKLLTTSKFSIDDVIFAHSITLKIIEAWEFRSWLLGCEFLSDHNENYIEWYLRILPNINSMRNSELRVRTSNRYHWISLDIMDLYCKRIKASLMSWKTGIPRVRMVTVMTLHGVQARWHALSRRNRVVAPGIWISFEQG